jgi:hypothetical protein
MVILKAKKNGFLAHPPPKKKSLLAFVVGLIFFTLYFFLGMCYFTYVDSRTVLEIMKMTTKSGGIAL